MLAPVPFNVVLPPGQILTFGPASTTGKGFTVSVTLSKFEHPFASVAIKVYVVVVVALETGLAIVALLNDPEGNHK